MSENTKIKTKQSILLMAIAKQFMWAMFFIKHFFKHLIRRDHVKTKCLGGLECKEVMHTYCTVYCRFKQHSIHKYPLTHPYQKLIIYCTFVASTVTFWFVKGLYYIEHQSFCPVVWIGSPHPLPRKRVCLPPDRKMGGDTLAMGWGDPIQTTGQKLWYSTCI